MASSTVDAPITEKSPAQLMAERDSAHQPTIEDVLDEEDIEHPPPPHASTATESAAPSSNGVMSTKAAGKQKEKASVLDTGDEEAFPTLGGGPKPAQAPSWGSKGTFKSPDSPALSGTSTPTRQAGRTQPNTTSNLPSIQNRDHFDIRKADLNPSAPIQKVLDDAKRKYRVNTGIQEISGGMERRFFAEGPVRSNVRQALLDISKAVSVVKDVDIPVPASVSPIIIGRNGANITQLQQKHGVRINIERDGRPASTGPEDPRIDVVKIKGDAASVREVEYRIQELVKQHQPKVNMPLRNIPPEFYPFLRGQHATEIEKLQQGNDLEINIPHYHTWQAQPPPRAVAQGRPQFVPHGDSHIILSGDQESARQAETAIQQLVKELEQQMVLEELACEQVLHPYLVGERGMDPLKFLEQTGCVLIVPPGHQETDEVHIIGPADRLDEGRELAERLMSEKYNRPVDLSKHFAKAPQGPERHSRALAQYLQQKALEREFLDTHNSEIVFPGHANAAPSWSVISSDQQKSVAAKNDLMKITQAFPPSRIQLLEMDPYYHSHIGNQYQQQLQDDHGVMMIVPDDADEPIVLVYEGPAQDGPFTLPRQRPTSPEEKEFERALQAAQEFLFGQLPSRDITARDVPVPRKHHDRVRQFVRTEQEGAPAPFPVQLDFGEPRGKRSKGQMVPENVFLRGPSPTEVEDLRNKIEAFLLEVEEDEKQRDYVTTCDFPEKFVKNLVGKNGSNINALREKHDVGIDTRETGKVKIQGPQKKAEACKAEIIKLGKQFEDETTDSCTVPPQFHGQIIGKGGEDLKRLQDKVNGLVRIDFPRASKAGDASDNASDAGGPQRQQRPDEIRLRGPKAKVAQVKSEILELLQFYQDQSHTATVSVHKDQIRSLIGRGGSELEKLRADTGANIDVPNDAEGDRVTVTVKGTKAAVDKARQQIQGRAKEFDSVITKKIDINRKYHRELVGRQGQNIHKLVVDAGGPERHAEVVQFPKAGDDSSEISVRGTQDVVDKIVAAIQAFADNKENQVTEVIDVPTDQHRLLIGSGGNIRKSIEERFKVALDVPRRETGQTGVKIAGRPDAVTEAREHIESLTKQPDGVTIMVPKSVHHAVSNEGRLFRDLSRQGIKVDHKGQKPPQRPGANGSGRGTNTIDAPLITDDPSDTQQYQFQIISLGGESDETGEIPWVLIGNRDTKEDAIAKVQRQIQEAIEKAQEPRHVGYLRLADPKLHRHVIGRNGATINSIRKQTGCDIQVPGGAKSQNNGEEITITGQEENVYEARDMILDEIEKAGA